jgi:septum formation protein
MIYLASASPRRCELLQQIGIPFHQIVPNVAEIVAPGECPQAFVQRLALEKARAGLALVTSTAAPVLGADTVVVLHGEIFGKPCDSDDAQRMLTRLSAQTHEVMTAVAVTDGCREDLCLNITQVRFAPLDSAVIAAYVATGEAFDKAGAYAIQGRAAVFIEAINGSYSGVMGLPLYETAHLLRSYL